MCVFMYKVPNVLISSRGYRERGFKTAPEYPYHAVRYVFGSVLFFYQGVKGSALQASKNVDLEFHKV